MSMNEIKVGDKVRVRQDHLLFRGLAGTVTDIGINDFGEDCVWVLIESLGMCPNFFPADLVKEEVM